MIDVTPFQTEITAIEARFLLEVDALLKRLNTLSKEEQLALLREIDFMTRLNTHGIDKVLGKMSKAMTARVAELAKTYTAEGLIVTATFAPLGAIIQSDMDMFLSQYESYAKGIKQSLIQGVATSTPTAVLVKQLTTLSGGTLSSRNAFFILEETFSRFDGAIKATIFEDKQDTARWTYLGALDDRNRDSCRAVLEKGDVSWTIEEINAGLADPDVDFVSRGGFNCRHTWELAEAQPEGVYE